jgi:hypothetical protein
MTVINKIMKSIKRMLRLAGLGLLIILALSGISVTGVIFLNKKEQDYENEIIKTELVEEHPEAIEEKELK